MIANRWQRSQIVTRIPPILLTRLIFVLHTTHGLIPIFPDDLFFRFADMHLFRWHPSFQSHYRLTSVLSRLNSLVVLFPNHATQRTHNHQALFSIRKVNHARSLIFKKESSSRFLGSYLNFISRLYDLNLFNLSRLDFQVPMVSKFGKFSKKRSTSGFFTRITTIPLLLNIHSSLYLSIRSTCSFPSISKASPRRSTQTSKILRPQMACLENFRFVFVSKSSQNLFSFLFLSEL